MADAGALNKAIDKLIDTLNLSETDAVVAVMCAAGGFTIDFYLLPGGMPPGTVTTLFGTGGFLSSKLFKRTKLFKKMMLKRLDSVRDQIGEERYKRVKEDLMLEWASPGLSKHSKKK